MTIVDREEEFVPEVRTLGAHYRPEHLSDVVNTEARNTNTIACGG